MRRSLYLSPTPCSSGWAGAVGSTSICCQFPHQCRYETTGKHHQFEPGPVAKLTRKVFTALTPKTAKKMIAKRMQAGLERVERMEKESAWLRKHGSPLRVLDLPDHASFDEVRARYTDMILDTHPDTAQHNSEQQQQEELQQQLPSSSSSPAGSTAATEKKSEALTLAAKKVKPARPSFQLVREAHAMVMNPNSVYHLNGTNHELLREVQLYTKQQVLMRPDQKFAIGSYLVGFLFAAFVCLIGFAVMWEGLLQAYDPEFYKYMRDKEKDEAARRAAGEEVDTDPKRLAPKKVQQLYYPGKYIHGDPDDDQSQKKQVSVA